MADQQRTLSRTLDAMKGKRILVVGDIMLDRYVYGQVDRISPESPVPILSVRRQTAMLGGAGNALANTAALETSSRILSVIGDDEEGRLVRRHVEDLGVDPDGLLVDPGAPTIVKTRFLAGHQQLLRTDWEKKGCVPDSVAEALLRKAAAWIPESGALLISDYGKGLLRDDVLRDLIALARKGGVPVIVDPKGRDFSRYAGASVITPNKKELSEATQGMPVETDTEVLAAASRIIETCGVEAVLATRSAEGMSLIRKGCEPVHFPARDIEVFDVSGAGDTVIATLAASVAAGADLEAGAALANIAGGIVVAKVGTAPIRMAELVGALEAGDGFAAERDSCILNLEAAAEQVRRWRARGLKIGFTNGCFDILHAGHVSYLGETRRHCDRLIVGLNNDSSVKILKGPGRPVHDEASRAVVLAALSAVDMVILFGAEKAGQDNTASGLIRALQPDVYFKGGDYRPDDIPEAPLVRAGGGEVLVMGHVEGQSTTKSQARIAGV